MKASLKFRDDRCPVLRAKIPLAPLFGLPLFSRFSAGEPGDLRLHLSTAFEAGPSLRASYHPNDPHHPLAIAVRIGAGAMGSPIASPITMTAELGLPGGGGGGGLTFSVAFKPCAGNFRLKKVIGSPPAVPHGGAKENGLQSDLTPRAGNGGGIHGLFSGPEVTTTSVVHIRSGAAVSFRWGLRIPAVLHASSSEDLTAGISFRRLPYLVMGKISIERVAVARLPTEFARREGYASGGEAEEGKSPAWRQLERVRAESELLRRQVEDLRARVRARRDARSVGDDAGGGKGVKKAAAAVAPTAGGREHRIGSGSSPEKAAKAREDELRKALMGAVAEASK